jgi:hypothetical protein
MIRLEVEDDPSRGTLADLFHPLRGPRLLLRIVDPVPGNGFFDGLLGVGRLHISDQSGGCGADARDTPLEQLATRGTLGHATEYSSAWPRIRVPPNAERRLLLKLRVADIDQCLFAQAIGIAFASPSKVDDFFCDDPDNRVTDPLAEARRVPNIAEKYSVA